MKRILLMIALGLPLSGWSADPLNNSSEGEGGNAATSGSSSKGNDSALRAFLELRSRAVKPGGSTNELNASQTEMVAAHNRWRAQVGVPDIAYSDMLEASAQEWADNLKNTRQCRMQHSPGHLGENLYWAGPWSNGPKQDVSSTQVVNSWSSEKSDYNYADNRCAEGKVCGHYTQVVWKNTTSVGCAVAVCRDNSQVWVCQYKPAGNYVGQKPY
ncbi:MAG: CAP domain-containing protein [Gallionella sp.]|nr:CAP domain-containing protein [Gallionella sp.]